MNYAKSNDMARRLCGLPPSTRFPVVKQITEKQWIAADIANNVDRPAQNQAAAMAQQIKANRESWL